MRLYALLQEHYFPSFTLRTEPLLRLRTVNAVIVVGSTAAGKTTLESTIRTSHLPDVSVPKKVVTRELRPDDNPDDVVSTSASEFSVMTDSGQMGLYWERPMENGRITFYGRLEPEPHTFPLYFANNAVITNRVSVKPTSILDTSLVLLVFAPHSTRAARFRKRSADYIAGHEEEAAFREAEHSLAAYSGAHIIIKNFGQYEPKALQDTIDFVRLVALMKLASL